MARMADGERGSGAAGGNASFGAGAALVAAVVFVLGFFPLRSSYDEWWHLKAGKWIVEHGYSLPQKDVFTYTAADYDWDNHEWLSEVGMYVIWRWGEDRTIGGWRAVILAKALLLAGTWLLLLRFLAQRMGAGGWSVVAAVFVALVAASVARRTFWPRPPVITYFFLVFFLYVMWLHRSGRLGTPWLLVLPALMPLWANLHGGFLLGGVVVGAYFAGEAAEMALVATARRCRPELGCPILDFVSRLTPPPIPPARAFARRAGVYLALGVLVGLGSLATPYGYKLYLLSHRVMSSRELVPRLSELLPPDFKFTWGYVFLLGLLGAGFATMAIRTALGRRGTWPPAAEIFLTGFFFWQSIHHVRHLPLMGLVGAPVAAWMLREASAALGEAGRRVLRGGLLGGCAVCASWLLFFPGEAVHLPLWWGAGQGRPMSAVGRSLALARGMESEPGAYPVGAMDFVLRARLPGRMFNANYLAGYPIWRLSPEHYRVFTDNRFDIFGGDFLIEEMSVRNGWQGGFLEPHGTPVPPWTDVIEKWRINWLFLERDEKVNTLLGEPGSGWALIYDDGRFVIWLKRTDANQAWIDRYERGR